jgi:GMP synthase-like glutamine amidotransferase
MKQEEKMKILLVNNNTLHIDELHKALKGHEVEIQDYKPGIKFNEYGKDLVILSGGGGEGKELNDYHRPNELWYEDEIKFIQSTSKPIVGICMGFEIIAAAHGAKVTQMPKGIEQYTTLKMTIKGRRKIGRKNLWQFEAHDWRVKSVPRKYFEVLAKSKTGVEIIRHKTRPIVAVQFHPEMPGGTLGLSEFLQAPSLLS